MKLKTHPDFPREKETKECEGCDSYHQMIEHGCSCVETGDNIGYNQARTEIGELELSLDVEKIAIACYLSLKDSIGCYTSKEDWKIESDLIKKEYRGYAQAIVKAFDKGEITK